MADSRVSKGFEPIKNFEEDLFKELEKPISTQNLDIYIKKLQAVIKETHRASEMISKDIAKGIKVDPNKYWNGMAKEAHAAIKIMQEADAQLSKFGEGTNVAKNFQDKIQQLRTLRNAASTIDTTAKLTYDKLFNGGKDKAPKKQTRDIAVKKNTETIGNTNAESLHDLESQLKELEDQYQKTAEKIEENNGRIQASISRGGFESTGLVNQLFQENDELEKLLEERREKILNTKERINALLQESQGEIKESETKDTFATTTQNVEGLHELEVQLETLKAEYQETADKIEENNGRIQASITHGGFEKTGMVNQLFQENEELEQILEDRRNKILDTEEQIRALVDAQENEQDRSSVNGKASDNKTEDVSDFASISLSRTKQEIAEIRSEIAPTSQIVSDLASEMKRTGAEATSTAIAMSQSTKPVQEALRTIDDQIADITRDLSKIDKGGFLPGKAWGGETEEENALIQGMVSTCQDYIDVLEVLKEARAKAFVASSSNALAGGIDKAQTDEQKELYKQLMLAMGEYFKAKLQVENLKQSATPEEAQGALDDMAAKYNALTEAVNAFRDATGQAAVEAKEINQLFYTHGKRTDKEFGEKETYARDNDNGATYSMESEDRIRQHGERVRDKYKGSIEFEVDDKVDEETEGQNENLDKQIDKVESLREAYEDLETTIKDSMDAGQEAASSPPPTPPNPSNSPNPPKPPESNPSYYVNSLLKKNESKQDANLYKNILATLESGAPLQFEGVGISNAMIDLQNFMDALSAIKEKLQDTYEFRVVNHLNTDFVTNQMNAVREAFSMAQNAFSELAQKLQAEPLTVDTTRTEQAEENISNMQEQIAENSSVAQEQSEANTNAIQEESDAVQEETSYYDQLLERIQDVNAELQEQRDIMQDSDSANLSDEDIQDNLAHIKELEAELKQLEAQRKLIEGKNHPTQSTPPNPPKPPNPNPNVYKWGHTVVPQEDFYRSFQQFDTTSPFSRIKESVAELAPVFQSAQPHLKKLGSMLQSLGGNAFSSLGGSLGTIRSAIASLGSSVANLASNGFNMLRSSISTTMGTANRLVSGSFNGLRNGISILGKSFNSLRSKMSMVSKKATPNLLKSLTSIKSMLIRRVKRSFISGIFNDVKAGLGTLAKYDKEFNTAMTGITTASKTLKANLAVTFGSLIQIISPVLTTILNAISTFVNSINAAIASLSGKSSYKKAIIANEDYAKSANKASGAQSDLNRQLYGFDELTRQEDNKSSGGATTSYSDESVEEALSGTWQSIIDAIKNGQWEEAGALVAEGLNGIIQDVDDKLIEWRSVATEWAANIAEFGNGFIENLDWGLIGKTIGDGINLITDTLNTFLTKFHFDSLGKGFAEGIMGIFNSIDWNLLGETVANFFNAVWQTLANLFGNLDWATIGNDFALGVGSFFENLDYDSFADMFINGINGVVEALWTFIDGVDWDSISQDWFNAISTIINGINWENLSGLLSEGVNKLTKVFYNFVSSDIIVNLGSKIGKTLGDSLKDIDWGQLSASILLGILKLRTAFWKLITFADFPSLATQLSGAINGLLTDESVKKAWDDADKAATEGINSIIDAFKTLVADPSEGGIDFTGIASDIGTRAGNLLSGINWQDLVDSILTGAFRVRTAFWTFVERLQLKNTASRIVEGINGFFTSDSGKSAFEESTEAATKGVNSIIEAINKLISPTEGIKFGTIRARLVQGIRALLYETDWDSLVSTIGQGIIRAVSEFFKLVADVFEPEEGESLGDKLANGINGIFKKDGVVDLGLFEDLGKNLGDAIKGLFNNIADFFETTDWEAIGESIGTALANIDWLGIAKSLLRLLYNALIAAGELIGGAVSNLVASLLGIDVAEARQSVKEDAEDLADDAAQIYADKILDAMEGVASDNALIAKLAEYLEIPYSEAAKMAHDGNLQGVADALFLGDDELAEELTTQEGYTEVAKQLAEQLGITQEQAADLLGQYGAANKIAEQFGKTYEEALSLAQLNPEMLAVQLGISVSEAYELLGAQGHAQKLAEVLGISVDQACELLSNENNFEVLGNLLADGTESAKEKIMEGLYQNNASTEEVIAYFKSLGIDISETLAAEMVGAKPKILSSNRDMLKALDDAQTKEEVIDIFHRYGKKCTDEFADVLKGKGKDDIDAALYLLGQGVSETTIAAMNTSDLHNNLMKLVEQTGIDLETIAQALTVESGTQLENMTNEQRESLTAIAKALGMDVGDALGTAVPDALSEALKQGKEDVKQAADDVSEVADQSKNKANMEASAKSAAEGVNSSLSGELKNDTEVTTAAQSTADAVKEKYEKLPDDVKPYAEDMMEYIATAMTDKNSTLLEPAVQTIVDNVIKKVTDTLSDTKGAEIAKTFITGLHNAFADDTTVSSASATFAGQVVSDIGVRVNKANGDLVTQNLISGMKEAFEKDTTVRGASGEVANFAKDVKQQFSDVVTNASGKELGQEYIQGISAGMKEEHNNNLHGEAKDIGIDVVDVLADYINRSNGDDLGYYIMQGLADGLNRSRTTVCNIAYRIADDLVKTMEKRLEIGSPSKVFNQIGGFTMQGLENGLEGGQQSVLSTVSDLASAIIEEGEKADFNAELGVMTDGLDVVADKMSRIAQIFTGIGQTIAEMGHLEIPTVASGQVIPYKARVETITNNETNSLFAGHELEDALYSAFTRAMGSPENEQTINITLQADGRKLADIVSKYQRQQGRAWGV